MKIRAKILSAISICLMANTICYLIFLLIVETPEQGDKWGLCVFIMTIITISTCAVIDMFINEKR